jgi:hypothetical protein
MAADADSPYDALWKEYSRGFRDFDDMSLGRWMAQTLGQFEGKSWRLSHPLMGAYRLAAQIAHERQIWLQRIVPAPRGYPESACCRAPLLPLLTRDMRDAGLICQHCSETLVPFEELPAPIHDDLNAWAEKYAPLHAVAHWDDEQRKAGDYEKAFEDAAEQVESLLVEAGRQLAPKMLDVYPTIIWEDHDECLEIRPEDIRLGEKE